MSTYTEFWNLKEVILWNVQNYNLKKIDITFRLAYGENFKYAPFFKDITDIEVFKKDIIERTEDIDNFKKILLDYWIKVIEPEVLNEFKTFKTPNFSWVLTPVSNPRDRVLIYWKKIIETPAMTRKRYFENQLLYNVFLEYFNAWYTWISAPYPLLDMWRFDEEYWQNKRDFDNFDASRYDISFDAANIIKIWKDLLFNVATYNHELWARWLQNLLWETVNIHKIYQLDDSHIDGKISVLRPWIFLINWKTWDKIRDYLPHKFKNWECIFVTEDEKCNLNQDGMSLCSFHWACTNVLSINENTVCVLDEAKNTIKKLEERGFTVIPVQFRHCEIFWWWLHCATLDVNREDDFIDYTQ